MRKLIACTGTLFLLSIACAQAQTVAPTPAAPESVNGANVQAPAGAPLPPTPSLASVHAGMVARTIDALPASQKEKTRELNTIEDQNHAAADSPAPAAAPVANAPPPH